ncbi:lysosome-associated membrane glycoprotein 5 [Trichonephila clavata]|uniref:Lysosome-associated membrane glycoprotein 5 n=1 Tax=Trichonephila clavata TaxID=2740835 RepID=A0A8X6H7J6_TRICU|nr:lysosome-associated membrane glycoprotein 5 [Trichonephila clavata]
MYLLVTGYAVEKGEESTDLPLEKEKEQLEENEEEKFKDYVDKEKLPMEEDANFKDDLEKDMKAAITEATALLKTLEDTDEQETKPSEESPANENSEKSPEEPSTPAGEQKSEESTSGSKSTTSEENPETTSAASMLVTDKEETNAEKEEAPKDTFAVWSSKRKICLLAKFHAVFSIIYSSKGGEQKAEIAVPKNGYSKGKCGSSTKSPLLQVSWQKYAFTMMFNQTEEDNWVVTSMELTYDTSEPLFDGATNDFCSLLTGKKTARSKDLSLFETPLKKSYYCPAEERVLLYTGNKQVVTARIKELQLQPYEVEDGQFSSVHRCNKVIIDGLEETPFVQDETVPLAVGCTLALITLFILVGFSIHRAYHAAKVDYNSME